MLVLASQKTSMIFNFGSINIDHVYSVPHLPEPGETLTAKTRDMYLGGKGINQSIAISKAGGQVIHTGAVGNDGAWALEQINAMGVDVSSIAEVDTPTGHAIINVDNAAENAIVILSGANACLTDAQISAALSKAEPEDWILVQNETNLVSEIVSQAKVRGCKVAYSAAPFVADVTVSLLDKIDLLVVNEGEADALASALGVTVQNISVPQLLITKGVQGATLTADEGLFEQAAFSVNAVDTTGAGDTFLGSFLARTDQGDKVQEALRYASAASALQVTRTGAATAIPSRGDVLQFLNAQG